MADTINLNMLVSNLECTIEDAERLASLFFKSAKESLAKMKEGIDSGETEMIFKAAHSLKGSSGSLWLKEIQDFAFEIESAARYDHPFDYPNAYAKLSQMVSEVTVAR
jgi:HPt (histidine-containing phosphotransfer) domain-containing protein